ncbi:unnamed protein product, partial [marine sediment metagenome]
YMLLLALIIMSVGAILVGALLSYLDTSLTLTAKGEERAVTFYAADAGVEYALWNMRYNGTFLDSVPCEHQLQVNGTTPVDISVAEAPDEGDEVYRITSTAGDDAGTTIVAHVQLETIEDYFPLLDDAITGPEKVDLKAKLTGNIEVYGNVRYNDELKVDGTVTIYGTSYINPDWPDADDVYYFYLSQVYHLESISDQTYDISSGTEVDPYILGPLYINGNMKIEGSGVAQLNGTIFVTGRVEFKDSCT